LSDEEQFPLVLKWFHDKRLLAFLKAETKVKQQSGLAPPGVCTDVVHLLQSARTKLSINGQCTVKNLQTALRTIGKSASGPKQELIQRLHTHRSLLLMIHDLELPIEEHVDEQEPLELLEEEDDVCIVCNDSACKVGDDLIPCAGDHECPIFYHHKCLGPPFCKEGIQTRTSFAPIFWVQESEHKGGLKDSSYWRLC